MKRQMENDDNLFLINAICNSFEMLGSAIERNVVPKYFASIQKVQIPDSLHIKANEFVHENKVKTLLANKIQVH